MLQLLQLVQYLRPQEDKRSAIHYTPYTIHHTLYTIHYTPYTIHHTLYTIPAASGG
jgi:hypothetical protein